MSCPGLTERKLRPAGRFCTMVNRIRSCQAGGSQPSSHPAILPVNCWENCPAANGNALLLPGAAMICLGHSGYHFGLSGSGLIGKVFGQQLACCVPYPNPATPLSPTHPHPLAFSSGFRPFSTPCGNPCVCVCVCANICWPNWKVRAGKPPFVGVAVTLFVHDLLCEMYTRAGRAPVCVCRGAWKYFNNHPVH